MAETTPATSGPASTSRFTWAATLRMRSTSATDATELHHQTRHRSSAPQGEGRGAGERGGAAYKEAGRTGQRQAKGSVPCGHGRPSVIPAEVAHFDALGDDWWDPGGPMAPLHKMTPLRVGWARDLSSGTSAASLVRRAARRARAPRSAAGPNSSRSPSPARRDHGLDPAPAAIEAARRHAEETGAK